MLRSVGRVSTTSRRRVTMSSTHATRAPRPRDRTKLATSANSAEPESLRPPSVPPLAPSLAPPLRFSPPCSAVRSLVALLVRALLFGGELRVGAAACGRRLASLSPLAPAGAAAFALAFASLLSAASTNISASNAQHDSSCCPSLHASFAIRRKFSRQCDPRAPAKKARAICRHESATNGLLCSRACSIWNNDSAAMALTSAGAARGHCSRTRTLRTTEHTRFVGAVICRLTYP